MLSSIFGSKNGSGEEASPSLFERYQIDHSKKYGEGGYGATFAADGRVGYALDGTSTVATYADFSSAPLDATSTVSPVHLGVVFADDQKW